MIRVLVIDDQLQIRSTISIALGMKTGFEVVSVESGERGLQCSENRDFDLAIVDIYMPGIGGVKTIKQLLQRKPGLGIIAMSGVQIKLTARPVLDLMPLLPGLANIVYLHKPFRPKELLAAVEKAIVSRAMTAPSNDMRDYIDHDGYEMEQ